jgi:hypothetical protein
MGGWLRLPIWLLKNAAAAIGCCWLASGCALPAYHEPTGFSSSYYRYLSDSVANGYGTSRYIGRTQMIQTYGTPVDQNGAPIGRRPPSSKAKTEQAQQKPSSSPAMR